MTYQGISASISMLWTVDSREVNEVNNGTIELLPVLSTCSYCVPYYVETISSETTHTIRANVMNISGEPHTLSVSYWVFLLRVNDDRYNYW